MAWASCASIGPAVWLADGELELDSGVDDAGVLLVLRLALRLGGRLVAGLDRTVDRLTGGVEWVAWELPLSCLISSTPARTASPISTAAVSSAAKVRRRSGSRVRGGPGGG